MTQPKLEPNTANYTAQAARTALVQGYHSISVKLFVERAKDVAKQYDIPWEAITKRPEFTNLDDWASEPKTAQLLNIVSIAIQKRRPDWPSIKWCNSGKGLAPGGDFAQSEIVPNYGASVAHDDSPTTVKTPWQKRSKRGEKQMLQYLLVQLLYRPELPEAFSFLRQQSGTLRFASASACNIFITEETTTDDQGDALLAYVILVYESYNRRSPSIKLMPETPTSTVPRYNLAHSDRCYQFEVEHARARPGRATFGGQTLDKSLYCKTSWQDSDDHLRSEPFFYQHAHRHGQVPGLARVHDQWMDSSIVADNPYKAESDRNRQLQVLVLSDVGTSIMSCTDVKQGLCVMHDTIDVARRLHGVGVLHRDFSQGNILCPIYRDKERPMSATCAEAAIGTSSPSPQCLVIDLDHAKIVDGGSQRSAKFEVTGAAAGTPFFMAGELLHPDDVVWRKSVLPTVEELLSPIPQLEARFEHIFPEYKTFEKLQAALQCVISRTAELFEDNSELVMTAELHKMKALEIDKDPVAGKQVALKKQATEIESANVNCESSVSHVPRHDLESIFWVFFFACALPKGAENEPEDKLNRFMHRMAQGDDRKGLFDTVAQVSRFLHPSLRKLAPLLQKIASLLFRIPWCLLSATTVPGLPTLAHDVVRYMLLEVILDEKKSSDLLETKLAGVVRQLVDPGSMYRHSSSTTGKRPRDDEQESSQKRNRVGSTDFFIFRRL
ncbi:hypothetical protein BKA62DRAFT_704821, partial [Auriculariales sp. MPI-PUGE-AT-0066]